MFSMLIFFNSIVVNAIIMLNILTHCKCIPIFFTIYAFYRLKNTV